MGKTRLFLRLVQQEDRETFPSVQCNESCLSREPELTLIDVPGTQKFTNRITTLLPQCACVVFVVDAAEFKLAESSSLLFKCIISNVNFLHNATPLLIVCNKVFSDKSLESKIRSLLEVEIARLIRTAEADENIAEGAVNELLDSQGKFSFSSLKGNTSFLSGSVASESEEFVKAIHSAIINSVSN